MITVGLLWHSLSSGNLGVGALTESNIAIIREAAEAIGQTVRFIVLGTGTRSAPPALVGKLEAGGHAIEVRQARILRGGFRDQIRRCDLVVDIGEGDSFADIYGFKRFFYYWLSKNIVCSLGKPLILAPQTIGPFNGRLSRLLAKQVMRRCKTIFARDHLSSEYLRSLQITENCREAIDVAFTLPYQKQTFEAVKKTRVGINVSALLFNGGYTGANQFELNIDYPSTVRQIINTFLADPTVELHLVPHVIVPESPVEDDFAIAEKLAQEYPGIKLAPRFSQPSVAKGYIAGLDFFVGARMHSCVAAFSAGVPVIPMAYSRKFAGLFGSIGYEHSIDCKTQGNAAVQRLIADGYKNKDQLAIQVQRGMLLAQKRLGVYSEVVGKNLKAALISNAA
ncbi:polysaccharide pyruvyl transferase family protein [Comamonadaceae bacterium G21597-S1]|nr:polysaccharide pyruvyl transferase family protein [Comamonadaceae bacterium G21597-S1]